MKRKFKVQVERIDNYEVEIDDEVINEEWMEKFRNVFYDFDDLEEHAEHLAQFKARFRNGAFPGFFIEGYGIPLLNGEAGSGSREKDVNRAINIIVVDEDNDIDVSVQELKEGEV